MCSRILAILVRQGRAVGYDRQLGGIQASNTWRTPASPQPGSTLGPLSLWPRKRGKRWPPPTTRSSPRIGQPWSAGAASTPSGESSSDLHKRADRAPAGAPIDGYLTDHAPGLSPHCLTAW